MVGLGVELANSGFQPCPNVNHGNSSKSVGAKPVAVTHMDESVINDESYVSLTPVGASLV